MTGWNLDTHHLRVLDSGLDEARRRAGEGAACRSGCFGCCLGPFPITQLDADRLRRGLEQLRATSPGQAERIGLRAEEAMVALREDFPGDWNTGLLDAGRDGELFSPLFQMVPCPALDLEHGVCQLYVHRPVACRTYGFAVTVDDEPLTPCPLNYAGWPAERVETVRVVLTIPTDVSPPPGQTVVAAALRPR